MKPHQQRVIDEKTELDAKRIKLEGFINEGVGAIFVTLPVEEQDRLNRQLTSMNDYSLILGERIAAFK